MSERIQIVLLVLAVAILSISCRDTSSNQKEPVYRGKELSAWLDELVPLAVSMDADEKAGRTGPASSHQLANQIENAVRAGGTNDIPILLKLLKVQGEEWKANFGFLVLGSTAKPAVPALMKMLQDENPEIRLAAASALGSIGPGATDAVPILIQHIYDSNLNVQINARHALGNIHAQPDMVVPILIESLNKSHETNESYMASIIALGKFGTNARAAVPTLLTYLADTNLAARAFALSAIKAIDPKTATMLELNPTRQP